MYVSFYFPVSDFRDLRTKETIRNPSWPVFTENAKPFQQNLGEIRERPLGGIRGWVQEGVICEIGRSLEVTHKKRTRVRKRFYFDGSFSGYFSLGISGLMSKYNRSYSVDDLAQIANSVLTRQVRSRHSDRVVPLEAYGALASEIYANGATSSNKVNLGQPDLSRWVRSSRPIVVFEIPSDRLSVSVKYSRFQSWPFMQNNVRFVSGNLDTGREVELPIAIIEKKSRSEDSYTRQARMVLARLYCEFCLLQDSVFLLASNSASEISPEKSDYFCGRISDSLSRLTGAKRLSALRDPKFYDLFTKVFLDGFDVTKIDALANGLEIHGARRNLRQSLLNSHLWMRIANEEQLELVMEKVMGNKYENKGVVGAMGDNASADQSTFAQNVGAAAFSEQEMTELVGELETLKAALVQDTSAESLSAAAAIAEAQELAKENDGASLASALKKAGKWAFDVATKIGVTVAAAAIKKAAGL